MTSWCSRAAPAVLVALLLVRSAHAQMQLPGAVGGGVGSSEQHEGGGSRSAGSGSAPSSYAPLKPVVIEPPGEDTIVGHSLNHDGVRGEMVFDRTGDGLVLSKLTFVGEKISKPGQSCTVDVALTPAVAALADGRPAGAIRYSIPLPACPFDFDILDGAVLVTSPTPTCDYKAADCRISPSGLWGPHAADITPKRAKDLERERVRLETTMRANFRALLRKAGKDREAVKAIARGQAAFSSEREMTCRDYDQETVHGFCSTQITEARALALLAQFGPLVAAHERKQAIRQKPRSPVAAQPNVEVPEP